MEERHNWPFDLFGPTGEWSKTAFNEGRGVGLTQSDLPIMQLLDSVADGETTVDIEATLKLLVNEGVSKVGIVGFCLGGRMSWLGACIGKGRINACAMYHGGNIRKPQNGGKDTAGIPSPFDMRKDMCCPVLGHYGGEDTNPSPQDGAAYKEALAEQGLSMEVHVYEGAKHGFSVADSTNWQQAGADAAWPRTVAFFCKALGVPMPEKIPAPPEPQDPSKASPECTSGCAAMAAK